MKSDSDAPSTSVRIDGTTDESFSASLKAMNIQLRKEDRERLRHALTMLSLKAIPADAAQYSAENLLEFERRTRMCVHGLNFDEIMARDDALLSSRDRAF